MLKADQAMKEWPPLIQNLKNPDCYDHPVDSVRILETHISWVLLTGDFAYKIKKPVDLGFLDFTRLEMRHFYCREEIRLNQRLAKQLYIGALPITGDQDRPKMAGSGKAIEYAVKMRQFDDEALAENVMASLPAEAMNQLAETLAAFHASAPRSNAGDAFGTPEKINKASIENLIQIESLLSRPDKIERNQKMQNWMQSEQKRLEKRFIERKQQGFIRECHGDLHLGNIVWLDQALIPFDCIEFSADLRWIDVISELAFIIMDLETRKQTALAFRLLNRYLQITGDYAGLDLLNYYKAYRAQVRAKVALLSNADESLYSTYIDYAEALCQKAPPQLMITQGLSGSGKSYAARNLSETLPAVWLRSDIERKRLFQTKNPAELYHPALTDQTYQHLLNLSQHILKAGISVIVDATFLKHSYRQEQMKLAAETGSSFNIIECIAPIETLQKRIVERAQKAQDPSDANLAVLEMQMKSAEPLDDDEKKFILKQS